MSLLEFIRDNYHRKAHLWIQEPEFDGLYVRMGHRLIQEDWVHCLDIANVTASLPGSGSFSRLITTIQQEFPELWIYVENVHSEQFQGGLERRGFLVLWQEGVPSYYLVPRCLASKI